MEMSFFVMFPFQLHNNKLKLINSGIYNYTVNYYIYDFLKANDKAFTTEFGYRVEKYISLGLDELSIDYIPEALLKSRLPKKSNLVDFYLPEDNIYIESKAIELQPHTAVNPTDQYLYNTFRSSIFKAYFEQLRVVSKQLSPNDENFGIIITYKELFWSDFSLLYPIGREKYLQDFDESHMPPENVFIIDIYTWDIIVCIVKSGKTTLLEILKLAKKSNSNFETSNALFMMHLEKFLPVDVQLSYLNQEDEILDIQSRDEL